MAGGAGTDCARALLAAALFAGDPRAARGDSEDAVRAGQAKEVPEDFPRFVVPGSEKQMESLRAAVLAALPAGRPVDPALG